MRINSQIKILSAKSKPYDFDGKKGVTHKVRFNLDGEIFVVRVENEDEVAKYEALVGREGKAVLDLTSPAERINLSIVDFKVA